MFSTLDTILWALFLFIGVNSQVVQQQYFPRGRYFGHQWSFVSRTRPLDGQPPRMLVTRTQQGFLVFSQNPQAVDPDRSPVTITVVEPQPSTGDDGESAPQSLAMAGGSAPQGIEMEEGSLPLRVAMAGGSAPQGIAMEEGSVPLRIAMAGGSAPQGIDMEEGSVPLRIAMAGVSAPQGIAMEEGSAPQSLAMAGGSAPQGIEMEEGSLPLRVAMAGGSAPQGIAMEEGSVPLRIAMAGGSAPQGIDMEEGSVPLRIAMAGGSAPQGISMEEGSVPLRIAMAGGFAPQGIDMEEGSVPLRIAMAGGSAPQGIAMEEGSVPLTLTMDHASSAGDGLPGAIESQTGPQAGNPVEVDAADNSIVYSRKKREMDPWKIFSGISQRFLSDRRNRGNKAAREQRARDRRSEKISDPTNPSVGIMDKRMIPVVEDGTRYRRGTDDNLTSQKHSYRSRRYAELEASSDAGSRRRRSTNQLTFDFPILTHWFKL